MMDAWNNDPYELPILADARYACPCGVDADMEWLYSGSAHALHRHYAIKCRMPGCKRNKIRMQDWKDTPAEAIRAWNRRCLEASE